MLCLRNKNKTDPMSGIGFYVFYILQVVLRQYVIHRQIS